MTCTDGMGNVGRPGTLGARKDLGEGVHRPHWELDISRVYLFAGAPRDKILQAWMFGTTEIPDLTVLGLGSKMPMGLVSPCGPSPWLTDVSPLATPSHGHPIMYTTQHLCVSSSHLKGPQSEGIKAS